jgi:hypothetical protein
MRNTILFIGLLFCLSLFTVQLSHAQKMDRKERKEWKRKLKKTSPETFKQMVEENNELKGKVSSMSGQVSSMEARLREKDRKIAELQAQVSSLNSELEVAAAQAQQTPQQPVVEKQPEDESGVIFKVQIGAYRKKDLTEYDEASENFSAETSGEIHKYTLGKFRDYWEADTFNKYLREMGVKDAWIVPYKDGHRVPMKDVLEGVI